MRIEHEVTIAAPIDRVWNFLMDVPAMSQCIPGVENVEPVDENRFSARVTQRIGPISVSFDCQITVLSIDESSYTSSAQITGRDSRMNAGMKATMAMGLVPRDDGVVLTMVTDVDISGKIAQFGHGIIKQRATALLDAFGRRVSATLAPARDA